MSGLDLIMLPVANMIQVVCGNCGKNHPTGPDTEFATVALVFSVIAMVITCFCGLCNYVENQTKRDNNYKEIGIGKNKNIWHCLRYVYRRRKECGHGILDGLWYAYTMFNFTILAFLVVMFPVTIILPLCLGTLKVLLTYVVWYYGASIWAMVGITLIVWYLQLVGCTFVMFKPIAKEKKDG